MDNWSCGFTELHKSLSSLKRAGSKNYGVLENELTANQTHSNPIFFTSKVMPEKPRFFENSSFEKSSFENDDLDVNNNFHTSPIKQIHESSKNTFLQKSSKNSEHKRSNSASSASNTADSGFTSPKSYLSRSGSTNSRHQKSRKPHKPTDLLKSNFQYETKCAITFETYQNPVSLAVADPNLFVSCKGRQGCINYFKLEFKQTSKNNPYLVSQDESLKIDSNPLRIHSSFKIIVDSLPQEPNGIMINETGDILYVAINHFIAEVLISEISMDVKEIVPRRLIGRELEILHSIAPAPFHHFVVTKRLKFIF